ERLKADEGRQSGRTELRKHITRINRCANSGPDKNNQRENNNRAACKSHLFADDCINIVGICNRNHFGKAESESSAGSFSRGDAEGRLSGLKRYAIKPDLHVHVALRRRVLLCLLTQGSFTFTLILLLILCQLLVVIF